MDKKDHQTIEQFLTNFTVGIKKYNWIVYFF